MGATLRVGRFADIALNSLGFRVQGSGFRVLVSGLGLRCLGFRALGLNTQLLRS